MISVVSGITTTPYTPALLTPPLDVADVSAPCEEMDVGGLPLITARPADVDKLGVLMAG